MPLPVTTTHHLAELLMLSDAEFSSYFDSVQSIAKMRSNCVKPAPSTPPVSEPVPKTADTDCTVPVSSLEPPLATPKRTPMRAPKPGSLRAVVHQVLKQAGKPLPRAAIIEAAARERGEAINDLFRAKVGEVVNNAHDPFVEKVGYGITGFRQKGGDFACLWEPR